MKKLFLISMAIITVTFAKAQPVSDIAIIPIGVSLNSILRLQVVSGGNVEFVVNTIAQYTAGIPSSPATTTTFTVASSVNYEVNLYAESDLTGNDIGLTIPAANIGYLTTLTGTGAPANYVIAGAVKPLLIGKGAVGGVTAIIKNAVGFSIAGNTAANTFTIAWSLANGHGGSAGTLLSQNITPDRYAVNAFLDLDGL